MQSYNTSPALGPDDFPHDTYSYTVGAMEDVDEAMDPTIFDLLAHNYAVRSHNDYEHYGFPYPGTVLDQPVVWKLAVDCVREAFDEGRAQASAEASAKARRERD